MPSLEPRSLAGSVIRLLTFRLSRNELLGLDRRHLALGLVLTWLVGIGRTWDDPRAVLAQRLGLGSVAYVFVLAAVLWLVIAPLRTHLSSRVSYGTLLTFVTLTSPPAALYAIPVERFVSIDTAVDLNLGLLAVVAIWRVALLVYFLAFAVELGFLRVLVATLAPLAMIVSALTLLELDEYVMDVMAGVRDRHPEDGVNAVLVVLTVGSWFVALPLLIAYAALAIYSCQLRAHARRAQTRDVA